MSSKESESSGMHTLHVILEGSDPAKIRTSGILNIISAGLFILGSSLKLIDGLNEFFILHKRDLVHVFENTADLFYLSSAITFLIGDCYYVTTDKSLEFNAYILWTISSALHLAGAHSEGFSDQVSLYKMEGEEKHPKNISAHFSAVMGSNIFQSGVTCFLIGSALFIIQNDTGIESGRLLWIIGYSMVVLGSLFRFYGQIASDP